MTKLFGTRRLLKPTDKKNVCLLRHGSLEDFTRVKHSYGQIAKRLGMKSSTVANVMHRLKRDGPLALENRWNCRVPWKIGNEALEALLLSQEYLTKWAPLSLRQRVAKI